MTSFKANTLRKDYLKGALNEDQVDRDPFRQFDVWLQQAIDAELTEANAMIVASVGADGTPSQRTVLIKQCDERGLVFGSNFESRKGIEFARNARASALLYWPALERQVRITGTCQRCSDEESDALFAARPLEARISAVASPQSEVIPDRDWLESQIAAVRAELAEGEAPARPASWGGFRIVPETFEFWQGRKDRLHDRLLYRRDGESWKIERLAP